MKYLRANKTMKQIRGEKAQTVVATCLWTCTAHGEDSGLSPGSCLCSHIPSEKRDTECRFPPHKAGGIFEPEFKLQRSSESGLLLWLKSELWEGCCRVSTHTESPCQCRGQSAAHRWLSSAAAASTSQRNGGTELMTIWKDVKDYKGSVIRNMRV